MAVSDTHKEEREREELLACSHSSDHILVVSVANRVSSRIFYLGGKMLILTKQKQNGKSFVGFFSPSIDLNQGFRR